MKKFLLFTALFVVSAIALSAFMLRPVQSTITGKISPADAAEAVWAISPSDSVRGTVTSGSFSLQVKPGTYKVIIDAKEPRKDVVLANIEVKDQPVDLGEIVLQ